MPKKMPKSLNAILLPVLLLGLLLAAVPEAARAFHFPWDQGHDTFQPDPDDDDTDPEEDEPCKTGSPFEVASGNFIHTEQDFLLTTVGVDIDVARTYNSHDLRGGPFGNGWSFSLDQRLVETGDGNASFAICRSGSGKRQRFTSVGSGSYSSPGYSAMTLSKSSGGSGFVLTSKTGTVRTFDAAGKLLAITDRNGNSIHFSYDSTGFLVAVADDAGRTMQIFKGPNGKIASIVDPAGRTFTYFYDSAGNLVRAVNPGGGETVYSYDSRFNLVEVVGPGGDVLQNVTYDSEGRVRSYLEGGGTWTVSYFPSQKKTVKTDPLGDSWSLFYNDKGSIVRKEDPLGQAEVRTYDSRLNTTSITDKNGNRTTFAYDSSDNLIRITDPAGGVTRITYEPSFGLPTSITDPKGRVMTMTYDSRGNQVGFTDPSGLSGSATFDSRGLRTSFTDSNGSTTRFTFDAVGYLATVTDASSRVTTYSFDAIGNLVSLTDPTGGRSSYSYDANNHLDRYSSPANEVTDYGFDVAGNLVSLNDGAGHATTFSYDGFRRLTQLTNAEGDTWSFAYDAKGNLTTTTDPEGRTTTASYDALGRVIRKSTSDDVIQFTYDGAGNLTSVVNGGSQLSFEYNSLHQLTRAATAATAHQSASTITYTYDSEGNRLSMVDPTGATTTYQHDALNRVLSIDDSNVGSIGYQYDGGSRVAEVSLPNGVRTCLSYDSVDQLTELVHASSSVDLLSFEYVYDGMGRRTSALDALGLHSFSYDASGRLTNAAHPAPILPDEVYTYDGVGNRLTSHLSNLHTYSTANRLTEDELYDYDYDRAGNLIRKTEKLSGDQTLYGYSVANQLASVSLPDGTAIRYEYDGLGRRIEKSVGSVVTRYLYDGERLLLELDGSDNVQARYVHGPGIDEPISMERGGAAYFYLTDGTGSVRALSDAAGSIVQTYTYDSFGRILEQAGSLTNPFTYSGRELDEETGLYYLRARYYDPSIGRFLQEDPLRIVSTDLNLYAYVGNNPLNLTDPFGLDWLENLSNFAAGFGDSLTFGLTDWIRDQMGINGVVDKCSGFYKAGEYVELGGEILLTGGSAALKGLARGASRRLVRNEFRRRTRGIARNGNQLHHVNPLFGHPGGAPTLFPTGGLPGWIHSGRWNLKLLDPAAHTAAHRRLRQLENLGKTVVNPATTGGRAAANALRDCDCK